MSGEEAGTGQSGPKAGSPEASVEERGPFQQKGGQGACRLMFLSNCQCPGHQRERCVDRTQRVRTLTVPRGQEVAVGAEGQRTYADLRVCSVGSGFQSLQGCWHRGDLIWNTHCISAQPRTPETLCGLRS